MSAYRQHKTQFNDQDCLVETLREEGYEVIEHEKAAQLEGYHGEKRKETAEIVIPRRSVNKVSGGASNEIGFKKQKDGSFQAVVSDYDHGAHGQKWLDKVSRKYAEKKSTKLAQANGMKLARREEVKNDKGQNITRLVFMAQSQGSLLK